MHAMARKRMKEGSLMKICPFVFPAKNRKLISFDRRMDRHWFGETGRKVPINPEGFVPFEDQSHIRRTLMVTVTVTGYLF
jgi:hypothetical protein